MRRCKIQSDPKGLLGGIRCTMHLNPGCVGLVSDEKSIGSQSPYRWHAIHDASEPYLAGLSIRSEINLILSGLSKSVTDQREENSNCFGHMAARSVTISSKHVSFYVKELINSL